MTGRVKLDLRPRVRVQLHPATDRWMMGDRYGEVVYVRKDFIKVKLDKSGRSLRFKPQDILETI